MAKRWIACDGYDDGKIRFYFTDRPLKDLEIECDPAGHFHAELIAKVESGKRKSLSLSPGDISHREVSAEIGAEYA